MPNLLRDIWKGQISGQFDPLANWITLKWKLLNGCGFQENEADITPILNSEKHKALSATFRDVSQKVVFSAILDSRYILKSLVYGHSGHFSAFIIRSWWFFCMRFRLNVVPTSLNILARNKTRLIWSYAQRITRNFEGSDFRPFWSTCALSNSETRTFECMWFSAKWGRHNQHTQFRKP